MNTANANNAGPDAAALPAIRPAGSRSSTWSLAATEERPAGYTALLEQLPSNPYRPMHQSYLSARAFGARGRPPIVDADGRVTEVLPGRTALDPSPGGHLLFALRYDGVDLEALRRIFAHVDGKDIEATIRAKPASEYARRLWFLYEWMTGKALDVPPPNKLAHVPLLDPERFITCEQGRSQRHGVLVNCLGQPDLCPTIRRTPGLLAEMAQDPLGRLDGLVREIDPATAQRINGYLLARESRGSFEIEGIDPGPKDDAVFFALLNKATRQPRPTVSRELLHELQQQLVTGEDQERSGNYRNRQVWIGDRRDYQPMPEYIAPQAADVPRFMTSFCGTANWMNASASAGRLDRVVAGAATSALFVYIHPFMDGNGRISRLLLQQPITREPGPDGKRLIAPVSAAINRERSGYYGALDVWSRQVMREISWEVRDRCPTPTHDTRELYRFPDLTAYTTFIYRATNESVTRDVPEERQVLAAFDRVQPTLEQAGLDARTRELFFRVVKQNGWKLSKRKREMFPQMSDQQVAAAEAALAAAQAPA